MKKLIWLVLTLIWALSPTAVWAVDTNGAVVSNAPDFFLRIPLLPYDEHYANDAPFNQPAEPQLTYYVKGEARKTEQAVLLENGQTLLPLRLVAEACGAAVSWDADSQQASLSLGSHTASVRPGELTMLVNGAAKPLQTPPVLRNGVLYLPLRVVGEALGKQVSWQNKLGQGLVIVCENGADFTSRPQLNALLAQTYLAESLNARQGQLLDVGRAMILWRDADGVYYRNWIAVNEAVAWYDFVGAQPEQMAALAAKLGCRFRGYDPPAPHPEALVAFYDDGDAKIIFDVPKGDSFDAYISGDFAYITEQTSAGERFWRVNLNVPREQPFVPEEVAASDL